MTARRFLERVGSALLAKFGYTLVPREPGYLLTAAWRLRDARGAGGVAGLLNEMSLAEHLRALFDDLKVDCVLDVGANAGQYGRFLRKQVGYRGLILSFEPVAETYSKLCAAVDEDSNWRAFCLALGRENEKRNINVMKQSAMNSFLPPSAGVPGILSEFTVIERTETVEVRRLADLMPSLRAEFGFARPYLKLDTQGFDLEVVAGAGKQLANVVALQSEMSVRPIYRGMPRYQESLHTLEEMGFAISNMFLVTTQAHKMVQFDCVMVRKS